MSTTNIGIRLAVEGAAQATSALDKVDRGLGNISAAAKGAAAPLAGLLSAAAFGGKLVAVQREFDVLNSSLKTVAGGSAAAAKEMEWLKDFAKETPFGLAQATQGFVKMKALGLDPSRAALTSFGNTAAAMGKDLNQMIEAVADASTGEFERLKEFGIKASKQGDQVKLTFQGVTTSIGNNAAEITGYLEGLGNTQFAGAMADRAATLDGAIASLGDSWDELFRTISSQGVGDAMQSGVRLAEAAVGDLTTVIRALNSAAGDNANQTNAMAAVQEGLAITFETVAVLGANVVYTLKAVGRELAVVGAVYEQTMRLNWEGAKEIARQHHEESDKARKAVDDLSERILNARKQSALDQPGIAAASAARDAAATKEAATRAAAAKAARDAAAAEAARAKAAEEGSKAAKKAAEAELEFRRRTTLELIKGWNAEAEAAQKAYDTARAGALKLSEAAENAQANTTAGLAERLAAMRDEVEAIGLTADQLAELNAVKAEQVIADKEIELIMLRNAEASAVQIQLLEQEINLRKQLVTTMRAGAGKKADVGAGEVAKKAAKDAADEWQKAADRIEQDITDALMRGFESGKGFAEVLRDTVANMFKTLVLRPVIQATVQGGLSAVGLGGPAGQGGGLLGTVNTASNLYSAFGNGAGAAAGTLAASNLVGAAGGDALGTLIAGNAGNWGVSAAGVSGGASIMGSVAAAAPYLAAVLAVVSLAKALDDSGTPHTGGYGSYSAAGGATMGAALRDAPGSPFGLSDDAITRAGNDAAVAMAQAVVGMLDSTAQTFGQKAGYAAATAFADDTSKDGAWGALSIKLGDKMLLNWADTQTSRWAPKEFANGEAGAKEYAAAVALDVRNLLMEQTPEWADTMLQALGDAPSLDALAATVGQINAAASAFEAMGKASTAFAGVSESAASALVQAMGGAEAAVASLGSYYTNFYTESERAGIATADLTTQLASLGKELPTSREAFRAMVDAAIAAGDTKLAAGLINLQDEFAALVPAAEKASTAVSGVLTGLQGTAKSLQREIIELQGGDLRAFDTQGFTATEVQAYDFVASLTTLRDNLKANKTATDTLADTQQQAADTAQQAAADTLSAWQDAQRNMAQGWLDGAQTLQNARYESAQRELDAARAAEAAIATARTSAAQASIDAVSGIAGALRSAREALTGAASQPLTTTSYGAARGLIDQAAVTGNLNQAGLEDALKIVSGNTQSLFGRFEDWAMAQAGAAEPVAKLDAQAQGQMAAAQAIIATMRAQEEEAALRYDENKRVLGDQHNALMDSLQMQYEAQIAQIEATQSVGARFDSAVSAMTAASAASSGGGGSSASGSAALIAAISQLSNQMGITYSQAESVMAGYTNPAQYVGTGNSTYGGIGTAPSGSAQDLLNQVAYNAGNQFETTYNPNGGYDLNKTFEGYKELFPAGSFGSNYSVSGFQSYMNAVGYQGANTPEATELLKKWGAAMGLPAYAVGTPYVPEDGPAYLHKGEMVVPAAYNPNATGYRQADSNAAVVAELRTLNERTEQNESLLRAIVGFVAGTDRKLARVIKTDAITTETA